MIYVFIYYYYLFILHEASKLSHTLYICVLIIYLYQFLILLI